MEPDLAADLSHARSLLCTAYPGRKIIAHIVWDDNPVASRALLVDDPNGPDLAGSEVAQVIEFGDTASPDQPVVLVLSVSRSNGTTSAPEIANIRAPLRMLLGLSPMLFEAMKYIVDRRDEARLLRSRPSEPKELAPLETLPAAQAQQLRTEGENKRPAILIGFHWLEHGGAEKLAFDSVVWALAAGLRVIVVAAHNAEHRLAGKLPDSPDITFARMDRYVPKRRSREFLRNLVLRENARAIHIHHCAPLFEALRAIRSVAPDIHVISSTHITEYRKGGYVYASGRYGKLIDTQHVISRQLGDVLSRLLGSNRGIVLGRILEDNSEPVATGIFPDTLAGRPLRFLFVGRMSYQKRPVLLAMILRSLASWARSRNIQVSFDVVGEGPYLSVFERLLRRFNLAPLTRLHLANADVPDLMSRADILLLPSANEGLALVCYEAIRAGTIPISTDVGAQSELLPPEVLVDRDPRKALRSVTEIVDRLVSDPLFYRTAIEGLVSGYNEVSAEPTARDVLTEIYASLASSGETDE